MRIDVLTIFPDMFNAVLKQSILKRAEEKNIIELNFINIRDYTKNKHKKVDDSPYGGGFGMVMQAEPIYFAYREILKFLNYKPKVIYMTPQGKVFNQSMALNLSLEKHLILLCGHYEGVDERILEEIVDEEISIGDFVLTGGEIPAMVLIDSVCRLVKGVLKNNESFEEESHFNGLLEYPHYTRPQKFLNRTVPDILISGHTANIKKWRLEQAKIRTKEKRPDMFEKFSYKEGENDE